VCADSTHHISRYQLHLVEYWLSWQVIKQRDMLWTPVKRHYARASIGNSVSQFIKKSEQATSDQIGIYVFFKDQFFSYFYSGCTLNLLGQENWVDLICFTRAAEVLLLWYGGRSWTPSPLRQLAASPGLLLPWFLFLNLVVSPLLSSLAWFPGAWPSRSQPWLWFGSWFLRSETMGMDGYGALLLWCGTVVQLGHYSSWQGRSTPWIFLLVGTVAIPYQTRLLKEILLYMLDKQKQVDKDSSKIFFLPFTSLVYKI
jgi:hypothetical protein